MLKLNIYAVRITTQQMPTDAVNLKRYLLALRRWEVFIGSKCSTMNNIW